MRLRFFLAVIALASAGNSLAELPAGFGGMSRHIWCGPNQPRGMCGWLELTLVQNGARLCGRFDTRSSDGEQADGGPVAGVVIGRSAVLTLTSQVRDKSIWLGRLDHTPGSLRWEKLAKVKDGDADRPGITDAIPRRADLSPIEIQPPGKGNCGDM